LLLPGRLAGNCDLLIFNAPDLAESGQKERIIEDCQLPANRPGNPQRDRRSTSKRLMVQSSRWMKEPQMSHAMGFLSL
jgi:hypothetical protein